jgi:hypothetical protein
VARSGSSPTSMAHPCPLAKHQRPPAYRVFSLGPVGITLDSCVQQLFRLAEETSRLEEFPISSTGGGAINSGKVTSAACVLMRVRTPL